MISLFPHQQEALQETKDFDNIAVYHDMGLGKTFTGSEMMKRFGCKVNLIVCQKSKVQDWVEHFTDNYQMQVFDLTNKKQLGEYHGLSQGQRFFIVGVINYKSITHSKASCRNAWCLFYAERKINKMNIKEGICTGIGVIGSIIASAFGGWDTGLVTLLIFMGIDYFSGLVVAGVFHKSNKTESGALESKAGWKGLCRKCMTLLFVLIAYRLDLAIGVDWLYKNHPNRMFM